MASRNEDSTSSRNASPPQVTYPAMTLKVSLEDFPEAVHRYAGGAAVYVSGPPDGLTVTAVSDESGVAVTASAQGDVQSLKVLLESAGLELREGAWEHEPDLSDVHIAAVAYPSKESTPGLWVDVFPYPPTQVDVLRAFFEELTETGEISPISFDQFMRHVPANVVILSPDELRVFAAKKRVAPSDT